MSRRKSMVQEKQLAGMENSLKYKRKNCWLQNFSGRAQSQNDG